MKKLIITIWILLMLCTITSAFLITGDVVIQNNRMRIYLTDFSCVNTLKVTPEEITINNMPAVESCCGIEISCILLGDSLPCDGKVSLGEVIEYIALWKNSQVSLRDVIDVINNWCR